MERVDATKRQRLGGVEGFVNAARVYQCWYCLWGTKIAQKFGDPFVLEVSVAIHQEIAESGNVRIIRTSDGGRYPKEKVVRIL